MKNKKQRICITVPPEVIEELAKVKIVERLNVSQLITLAWNDYYKKWLAE